MKTTLENFLSLNEEQEIVAAIRLAEKKTSGEIRIHLENTFKGTIENRALEVFSTLKMNHTKLRNGVLIYIAVQPKKFTIYGDKGIHQNVPTNFWDSIKTNMEQNFKLGKFSKGIIDSIFQIGEQLHEYFPLSSKDTNELSNEISKGS